MLVLQNRMNWTAAVSDSKVSGRIYSQRLQLSLLTTTLTHHTTPKCLSAALSPCELLHCCCSPKTSVSLTSSNTGLKVPQIGFGTWQAAPGEVEKA